MSGPTESNPCGCVRDQRGDPVRFCGSHAEEIRERNRPIDEYNAQKKALETEILKAAEWWYDTSSEDRLTSAIGRYRALKRPEGWSTP